ncbi:MAG TPA: hypothetical protein PLJ60_14410 [Chryseolinea sp.]|nr:hypothetical protein [Chryseolinea sp.]
MKLMKHLIGMLAFSVLLFACDNEDYTGHSQLKPTSPVMTVALPPQTDLDDVDQFEFHITVTMSVAQIVDVAVHSVQTGGDATHDDYSIEDRIIIPKGETEGTFTLHLDSDELIEGPLTLTLQIGDGRTANADITPVSFTVDRN